MVTYTTILSKSTIKFWKWKDYRLLVKEKKKKTRRYDCDLSVSLSHMNYKNLINGVIISSTTEDIVGRYISIFFFGQQEPEIEYVEGYDELEEEEDIEDFGGFDMDDSLKGDHREKMY